MRPRRHRTLVASLAIALVAIAATPPASADALADAPDVKSPVAVVLDAETGAEVWSRDADTPRPIASMTKIFVAMALRRHKLRSQRWTEITAADAEAAAGGARTRLPRGEKFRNLDLLQAMLMVSDNRAPTALGRSVGLDRDGLVAAMNDVAADLGLTHTAFTDPTGIDGNQSTARELTQALIATLKDRLLARVMSRRYTRITSQSEDTVVEYRSTVWRVFDSGYEVRGGKTGHTEAAGYCMMVEVEIDGHPYAMAFMGADDKQTRWDDFAAVAAWLDARVDARDARTAKAR